MNRKLDIEDLLMRFRITPGERVKRAVLARFAERRGGAGAAPGRMSVWRRPVPLYAAVALVLLAAGLSFAGGQRLSRSELVQDSSSTALQDSLIGATLMHSIQFAPRDAF
jgi:hypothetical protein